ncbi:hypothetical protein HU175_00960 [Spirosoma sp. KUDC1026]|nr:hypothetical protein HU175_00960 [Spirosoma sp. KUDC1026]
MALCILSTDAHAQRSEIWREKPGTWLLNAGLGTTHYTGDMSQWGDLSHLRLGAALSVAAAYRLSRQLSFRAETQVYYVRGSQRGTELSYNNLSFFSINPELWAGMQVDFWPVDDRHKASIPYALAGVGLTYMTPQTTYKEQSYSLAPLHTEGVDYSRLPLIVRYGLGVPVLATDRFKLHLEGTYTHVLSDYLDDVSTIYPDRSTMSPVAAALSDRRAEIGLEPNKVGEQRGNSDRNDGYFILSARFIFVLMTPNQRNYRRMFGG